MELVQMRNLGDESDRNRANETVENHTKGLSIGEVSKATGISVYTLRMWERRYGSPMANKLASGHRRYNPSEVPRLRLVQRALDLGFKPSHAVTLTDDELIRLIEEGRAKDIVTKTDNSYSAMIESWIKLLHAWDEKKLLEEFESEWLALGPIGFADERICPFFRRVGEGWITKEITVAQEHFATELAQAFLSRKWREQSSKNTKAPYVVATLPDEKHALGIHMCALGVVATGHKVTFLGADIPVDDLVGSVLGTQNKGVCISFTQNYDKNKAIELVKNMRQRIPSDLPIIVGGDGAPGNIEGVTRFQTLREFYEWMRLNHR